MPIETSLITDKVCLQGQFGVFTRIGFIFICVIVTVCFSDFAYSMIYFLRVFWFNSDSE